MGIIIIIIGYHTIPYKTQYNLNNNKFNLYNSAFHAHRSTLHAIGQTRPSILCPLNQSQLAIKGGRTLGQPMGGMNRRSGVLKLMNIAEALSRRDKTTL